MRRDAPLLLALTAAAVVAAAINLTAGASSVAALDALAALFGVGDRVDVAIVQELRAPRAALAFAIGAGLAASGAALQGYFRNPLADPGVVGVAPSASVGAVAALYFGLSALHPLALPLAALVAALGGTVLLFVLAGPEPRPTTLILSGVAISAFAGALTALALNLSPNPWALSEIAFWLMGSVTDRGWIDVALAAPAIGVGIILLIGLGRWLDLLTLGEDTAASLGLNRRTVRLQLVAGVLLAVAPGVAVAGLVGFVGLVTPHLLRGLVGGEPGRLILPSAVGGGALVLLADAVADALSGPGTALYLGVVTAIVGAPFFLWLIIAKRREIA